MDKMFREILKKQKKDIIFIEKQMRLFEALTVKRQEMIKVIMETNPNSIRELAGKLNRDVKNVFNDLRLLNSMDIVSLEKKGCCVRPTIKKKFIIIRLGR